MSFVTGRHHLDFNVRQLAYGQQVFELSMQHHYPADRAFERHPFLDKAEFRGRGALMDRVPFHTRGDHSFQLVLRFRLTLS